MSSTTASLALLSCILLACTDTNSLQISHEYLTRMRNEQLLLCDVPDFVNDWDTIRQLTGLDDRVLAVLLVEPACSRCRGDSKCLPLRRCCIDIMLDRYTDGEVVEDIQFHCTMTQFKLPGNRQETYVMNGISLIDTCMEPHHLASGGSDLDKLKCENRNISNIDEVVPVVSNTTGLIYVNEYCAICHADAANITPWNAYVGLANPDDEPEILNKYSNMNWQEFYKLTYDPSSDLNMYFTPGSELDNVEPCASPSITKCNVTGLWKDYDEYYEYACAVYRSDYFYANQSYQVMQVFGNVFCLVCNGLQPDWRVFLQQAHQNLITGFDAPAYMGLLNYKDSVSIAVDPIIGSHATESCPDTDFFDPVNSVCRPWICPRGTYYNGELCITTLTAYRGMELLFFFRVGPVDAAIYSAMTSSDVYKATLELADILKVDKLGYVSEIDIYSDFYFQQISAYSSADGMDVYLVFIFATHSIDYVETYLDEVSTNNTLQFTMHGTHMTLNVDSATEIGLHDPESYFQHKTQSLVLVNIEDGSTFESVGNRTTGALDELTLERVSRLHVCTMFRLHEDEYIQYGTYLTLRKANVKFYSTQYETDDEHSVRICVADYVAAARDSPLLSSVSQQMSVAHVTVLALLSAVTVHIQNIAPRF